MFTPICFETILTTIISWSLALFSTNRAVSSCLLTTSFFCAKFLYTLFLLIKLIHLLLALEIINTSLSRKIPPENDKLCLNKLFFHYFSLMTSESLTNDQTIHTDDAHEGINHLYIIYIYQSLYFLFFIIYRFC